MEGFLHIYIAIGTVVKLDISQEHIYDTDMYCPTWSPDIQKEEYISSHISEFVNLLVDPISCFIQ
jgi:hypothetical protein